MKKIISRVLTFALFFLVLLVIKTLYDAGVFKSIKPHFAGSEKVVKTAGGAEDIIINRQKEVAYLSVDKRRTTLAGKPTPTPGSIYYLDLKKPDATPVNMLPDFKREFHPHGMSYFRTSSGKELLFVVNHSKLNTHQTIEKFEIRDTQLVYLESIQHNLMTSPNDVVAVGERQFYVTNDHRYLKGWLRTMEDYLKLPLGSVNFYDGKTMKVATSGIAYANGINISSNKKMIFVASPTNGEVIVYTRQPDHTLELVETIKVHTGVDNIELDEKGHLWLGCHPKLFAFVAHQKDSQKKSPSQVIEIIYQQEGIYEVKEVYLNNGNSLSGSSAAVAYKDHLLIGGVFDKKVLWCKMKPTTKDSLPK
ncbi:serum paraoxonase/arylesterase 2 [Microscilla marina]|uniref:Serum paraoxonase/arylesterase 2 n=1 Tax=Microscilla marina ATCC 23134 TaxID=313606 RepID=A1ZI43_MICM2|nr:serum paraoxonase/arylesterase 2 [Microscilla marina]EAY29711.1 serum paraoxonase/arylesterase 2 [Microscilla marina ATCC 23134]